MRILTAEANQIYRQDFCNQAVVRTRATCILKRIAQGETVLPSIFIVFRMLRKALKDVQAPGIESAGGAHCEDLNSHIT